MRLGEAKLGQIRFDAVKSYLLRMKNRLLADQYQRPTKQQHLTFLKNSTLSRLLFKIERGSERQISLLQQAIFFTTSKVCF